MGTNKLRREIERLLKDAGVRVLDVVTSPHLKYRCRNKHGIDFLYVCSCSPRTDNMGEARRVIRKYAALTESPRAHA